MEPGKEQTVEKYEKEDLFPFSIRDFLSLEDAVLCGIKNNLRQNDNTFVALALT